MNLYEQKQLKALAWFRKEYDREPTEIELKTMTANFISQKLEKLRRTYKITNVNGFIERMLLE